MAQAHDMTVAAISPAALEGAPRPMPSFRRVIAFWWILYLVMMSAERLFLLPAAVAREPVGAGVIGVTVLTGFKADLIVASVLAGVSLLAAAAICGAGGMLTGRRPPYAARRVLCRRCTR